jgi:CTP:molybdopterin cytidylyltransferase MocA
MKPIAIILAAGESRRMGVPKALLEVARRVTFLAQLVETFDEAGVSVLVVTGAHALPIQQAHPKVATVLNGTWELGQFSSVQVGLRAALAQGASRILIHPVDAPMISVKTVKAVLEGLTRADGIVPMCGGLPGHPLGLRGSVARDVLASPAATLAEAAGLVNAELLELDDAGILENFNSPESYSARFGHPPR